MDVFRDIVFVLQANVLHTQSFFFFFFFWGTLFLRKLLRKLCPNVYVGMFCPLMALKCPHLGIINCGVFCTHAATSDVRKP